MVTKRATEFSDVPSMPLIKGRERMTNSYLLVTNARQTLKPKDSLIALMEVLTFCSCICRAGLGPG